MKYLALAFVALMITACGTVNPTGYSPTNNSNYDAQQGKMDGPGQASDGRTF